MKKNIIQNLDTHRLVKKLESSKLTNTQSETIMDVMKEINEFSFHNIAHKKDLEDHITQIRHEFTELEMRLIIKLGSLISISMATLAALTKIM